MHPTIITVTPLPRTPGASWRRNTLLISALGIALLSCKKDSTAPGILGSKLVFTVQPSASIVDSSMSVSPVVVVEDANGNIVSGSSNIVQLTLTANANGANFVGTTTVVASGGVATFSHFSLDRAGAGYTLTATSPPLTPATSTPFDMAYQNNGLFASINIGASSACGLTTSSVAFCWGSNTFGQLGNGAAIPSFLPFKVASALTFSAIAPGSLQYYTCGLVTGGAAYCWGYNDYGQLGNGTQTNSLLPVPVSGSLTFASLSVGLDGHACAVTAAGAAYCWGYNATGQSGSATSAFVTTPQAVPGGLSFTSVTAGQNGHTCGIAVGGAAYCWGFNGDGELGNGGTASTNIPVAVAGGHVFTRLSAGFSSTCGVAAGGAAFCWGDNTYGQLGAGSIVASKTPVAVVGGLSFTSVSVGDGFACGVATTADAYCWGYSGNGQIGAGNVNASAVPVAVAGGLHFAAISAGYSSVCAVTSGGAGYCWGDNTFGQLGNGSTLQALTPALVFTPK